MYCTYNTCSSNVAGFLPHHGAGMAVCDIIPLQRNPRATLGITASSRRARLHVGTVTFSQPANGNIELSPMPSCPPATGQASNCNFSTLRARPQRCNEFDLTWSFTLFTVDVNGTILRLCQSRLICSSRRANSLRGLPVPASLRVYKSVL